jgi:hypothetical protein
VQVLGWLVSHGIDGVVSWQVVRLVRAILDYRVRCKEIELLREQSGQVPGHQLEQSASAHDAHGRHARS